MKVQGLSHVMLCATDIAQSRDFYVNVLGFEVLEEDPDHGGTFLALPGGSHVIDLVPVSTPRPAKPAFGPGYEPRPGVGHIALHVDSPEALREAYFELVDGGVPVLAAADHKSQQSVYFFDPDYNLLELCWERPNARELYLSGRGDDDSVLTFTRS